MWAPVDITALPTAQDFIDAKSAIGQVEIELKHALLALEQAQLRVNQIKQNLWERRAWIAPVRMLSSDVLSLVFEFCGEDNWETSLRIAGVSRQWRDLVLATPRAWAFLDVHKCSGYGRKELIGHFFKHSGQRPLHVYLNKFQRLTTLSDVIERLECLSICNNFQMEEYPAFPKLERFSLSNEGRIAISDLRITRFPALREFICGQVIERDVTSTPNSMKPMFPPLQVLSVTTRGDTAWLDLLIGCGSSLVSLKLYIDGNLPATGYLVLPVLKCLEILLWIPVPDGWPMDLKTPVLETYVESRSYFGGPKVPTHQDIGSVSQMRLDEALNFSAASLLRTLQLYGDVDINNILSQLQSSRDLCPSLELIEAMQLGHPAIYRDSLVKANRQRSQPVSLVNVERWATALPFAIVRSPVSIQSGTFTPTNEYPSVDHVCLAETYFRRVALC